MTIHELGDEIRQAAPKTLDELVAIIGREEAVEALAERDGDEASIAWIPTFGGDSSCADGGDSWEVVSWDATRKAVAYYEPWNESGYRIEVVDR